MTNDYGTDCMTHLSGLMLAKFTGMLNKTSGYELTNKDENNQETLWRGAEQNFSH